MRLIEKIGMGVMLMTIAASGASVASVSAPVSVPEPSTWALLAIGVIGIFFAGRKK